MEKINENIIEDSKNGKREKSPVLTLANESEMGQLARDFSAIHDTLIADQSVGTESIDQLEQNIGDVKVGETNLTLRELKGHNVKRNLEIFEEVERFNDFNHTGELTFLTDQIAEVLSEHEGGLELMGLTTISDSVAEILSHHKSSLGLRGLTSLSDRAAEILSHYQGSFISLRSLTHLSDTAIESLSHFKGGLRLDGLTALSDSAAESLSHHYGDLYLIGLTTVSDVALESLSRHRSDSQIDLWLGGDFGLSNSNGEIRKKIDQFRGK